MNPPPARDEPILVSVIVPAHNAERWIEFTLKSAQEQTLNAIEIIVVDDGSTDRTAALVERQAAADSRIRLIRQANGGVGAARNAGILASQAAYLAPLDADDIWFPDKLELQLRAMEDGGGETGLVYCWSEKIDASGRRITDSFPFEIEGKVVRSLVLRNFIGNASTPMFRASAVKEVGLYLTREEQGGAQGCEDWDLSIRIAEHFRVAAVRKTLVGYRQVDDCMSLRIDGMSRSYEIAMDRARSRNPGLSPRIFRWSAGNFHSYLVSKCYLWGNYPDCLRSIFRAVTADPLLGANHKFYLMGLKSLVRMVTGKRGQIPGRAGDSRKQAASSPARPAHLSLSDGIQNRRWRKAVAEDGWSHGSR